jgi:hypothetical protein
MTDACCRRRCYRRGDVGKFLVASSLGLCALRIDLFTIRITVESRNKQVEPTSLMGTGVPRILHTSLRT